MQHAVPLALFAALTLGGATSESDAGQAPEPFVLEAGRHELVDVIERAADYLDHNYLYQETEFQAGDTGVTLQTKLALSPREAQEVLSQLLYSRGFLMVPLNEKRALWEIISVAGPRRAEITARPKDMSPAEVRANENLMIVVRTPVALHTINAVTASTALRPLIGQVSGVVPVLVGTVGDERALIFQGLAGQVADMLDLLEAIDTPAEPAPEERDRLTARVGQLEERVAELQKQLEKR